MQSVTAILVGLVTIIALELAADAVVRGVLPGAFDGSGGADSVGVLVLALAYVGVLMVAGCYLTARLAPSRLMGHALALGLLGLVLSVAGTIVVWESAAPWYNITSLVLILPYAWLGGRLGEHAVPLSAVAGQPQGH